MKAMLFGGLVIVVYVALAYARRFSAGCDGACNPEGLEYAFVMLPEMLVATLIVSLGTALVGWVPSPRRDEPDLEGVVGKPAQEQNSGPTVVDEAAAILNPATTATSGAARTVLSRRSFHVDC